MKRLLALLTALVILLATPALAVVDRPENGFVGDYAQVLDDELEEELVARGRALQQTTGAEIVIVSVDFMDGMDAESYAMDCFDQWGIGDESRNNGLLLVFAVGEDRVWAMRGTGLEKALSVSTLNGWLEDSFYDDYDAGNYDDAVRGFADAAYGWMERYYDGAGDVDGYGESEPSAAGGTVGVFARLIGFTMVVVVALVLLVVIFGSGGNRYRRRYGPDRYRYPIFFGRPWGYRPPPPPGGPHPPPDGIGGAGRSGGGFRSGGTSRGGGAGRRGSGGAQSSSHSSFRSSSRGSFHSGGGSRGGGAGRR